MRYYRAQIALLLSITPETVDDMPVRDMYDVFYAHNANSAAKNFAAKHGK